MTMPCPICDASTLVRDSRPVAGRPGSLRRRRECRAGHRFSTVETVVSGYIAPLRAKAQARKLAARGAAPLTPRARADAIEDARLARQLRDFP